MGYQYGAQGELKRQQRQHGTETSQSVEYDAMYRTISFNDGSNLTNYFYNANGDATATAYPGANLFTGTNMERTTAFDNSGLPLQTIDGRGVVSNIAYTPDGLPQSVSYPASPGENVTLAYNAFGQPTGRTDASGEEAYAYNSRGGLTSQSTRYRNAAGNLMNPFVQNTHLYASGALQQLATTVGNLGYAYDAAGRLTAMSDPDGATTAWNYDVRDQLSGQTLPTGTTTAITHNVLGQLTSQRHAKASNATLSTWGHPTDSTQNLLYNTMGQLVRNTASTTPDYAWGGTTTYDYTNWSQQLTSESSTRGAGYNHNYAYSVAQNPTMWKGQPRSFNPNNQETTAGAFTYDGAGNTTQMPNRNFATPTTAAPTQKLVYNAQGQLAELRDASNVVIARYVYRGDGKRAWKELADGTRSYSYYAGEQLIAATNGNDLSSLRLWGADGLIGSRTFNSTTNTVSKLYNLYDPQGNLAQIVDADSGNVVNQSAVSAWGEPLRDSAGNTSGGGYGAKFGYVRDGESGFYLCTLRYYDPSAGRWITRDPIGYAGGSNLYGYVGNDPVNSVDPSGLWKLTEPSSWFDGNGYQGLGSGLDPTYNKVKPDPSIAHPPAYINGKPQGEITIGSQKYHGPLTMDRERQKWMTQSNALHIYSAHNNKGAFDYKMDERAGDLYWIDGGWHSSGAMGNYAAGYCGQTVFGDAGVGAMDAFGGFFESWERAFGNKRADGWEKRNGIFAYMDAPIDSHYIGIGSKAASQDSGTMQWPW